MLIKSNHKVYHTTAFPLNKQTWNIDNEAKCSYDADVNKNCPYTSQKPLHIKNCV